MPHMGSCRITVHSGAGSLILAWFWSRDNRLHYLQYGMRLLGASPSYVSNPLDWFLTMERPSWTDSSINSSGIKRRLQTSNSSWTGYEHRIAAKLRSREAAVLVDTQVWVCQGSRVKAQTPSRLTKTIPIYSRGTGHTLYCATQCAGLVHRCTCLWPMLLRVH